MSSQHSNEEMGAGDGISESYEPASMADTAEQQWDPTLNKLDGDDWYPESSWHEYTHTHTWDHAHPEIMCMSKDRECGSRQSHVFRSKHRLNLSSENIKHHHFQEQIEGEWKLLNCYTHIKKISQKVGNKTK